MGTNTQVFQDGTRNLGSPKVRCLRNEREHMSTPVLESESRSTGRNDQRMEPTVDENRPIFTSTLETGTKSTTKTEDRQCHESCVDRAELAKPLSVAGGSETELNQNNELQDLQTTVLDRMAVIR
ncbi:hypothetical protein G6F62_004433 [Rhizopus arrhizus]|nr:hypothetical protein G6F62_004433 [Rhizopus arrhizus]